MIPFSLLGLDTNKSFSSVRVLNTGFTVFTSGSHTPMIETLVETDKDMIVFHCGVFLYLCGSLKLSLLRPKRWNRQIRGWVQVCLLGVNMQHCKLNKGVLGSFCSYPAQLDSRTADVKQMKKKDRKNKNKKQIKTVPKWTKYKALP